MYDGSADHAIGLMRYPCPARSGTVARDGQRPRITAVGLLLALAGCAAPPSEQQDVAALVRDPKVLTLSVGGCGGGGSS